MIDALRKDAWPRGVRRQRRELEAAREQLRRELGYEPSLADLAAQVGSDEKRLGRTIVRINTIESTSPLASGDTLDESTLPAALVPSEPERPDVAYEREETQDRVRAAIASLPPREQKVIGLYYYGEATMKQIGAEIGVNESRVSQLHARAIADCVRRSARRCRRLRRSGDAQRNPRVPQAADGQGLADATPVPSLRRSSGSAWRRLAAAVDVDRELRRACRARRAASRQAGTAWPASGSRSRRESVGVGAGDVAGHEDDAPRQRRRRRRHRAIERHPVDARHLQVADDQRRSRSCAYAGERFLAVARVIHLQSGIRQRLAHRAGERRARPRQGARRAPHSLHRWQSLAAESVPAVVRMPLTGSSTRNEAPCDALDSRRIRPPCSCDDRVGHGQARARCPCRPPWS